MSFAYQIFIKDPNIKFRGYPYSGSRPNKAGRTDGQADRQTDMTQLTGHFLRLMRKCQKIIYNRLRWTKTIFASPSK